MSTHGYSLKNNAFFQISEIIMYSLSDLSEIIEVDDSVFIELTKDRTVDGLIRILVRVECLCGRACQNRLNRKNMI